MDADGTDVDGPDLIINKFPVEGSQALGAGLWAQARPLRGRGPGAHGPGPFGP